MLLLKDRESIRSITHTPQRYPMSSSSTRDTGPRAPAVAPSRSVLVGFLNSLLFLFATVLAFFYDLLANVRDRELPAYIAVLFSITIFLFDFIIYGVFIAPQYPMFKQLAGQIDPPNPWVPPKVTRNVMSWTTRVDPNAPSPGSPSNQNLAVPEPGGSSIRRSARSKSPALPRTARPQTIAEKEAAAKFSRPPSPDYFNQNPGDNISFNTGLNVSVPMPVGTDLRDMCKVVDFAGVYLKSDLPAHGVDWQGIRNQFKDYVVKTFWNSTNSLFKRTSIPPFDLEKEDEQKLWDAALSESAWEEGEGRRQSPAAVLQDQKVVWLCEVKRAYHHTDYSPEERQSAQMSFLFDARYALCEQVGYLFSTPEYKKVLVLAFAGDLWQWAVIENDPNNRLNEFTINVDKIDWSDPTYLCSKDSFRAFLQTRRELFKILKELNHT